MDGKVWYFFSILSFVRGARSSQPNIEPTPNPVSPFDRNAEDSELHEWNEHPRKLLKVVGCFIAFQLFASLLILVLSGCVFHFYNQTCTSHPAMFTLVYAQVGLYMLFTPFLLWLLRSVSDSYYIRTELTISVTSFAISFLWALLNTYVGPFAAISDSVGLGGYTPLFIATVIVQFVSVTHPLMVIFYEEVRDGLPHIRREPSGTIGGSSYVVSNPEGFAEILRDRTIFKQFKMSAAEDFCLENVLFYEEYMALLEPNSGFRSSILEDGRPAKTMDLYRLFVKPGAKHELNVSGQAREEARKFFDICARNLIWPKFFFKHKKRNCWIQAP
jgi:hypothetical protein